VDIGAIVQGLTDLARQFRGEMWLEVLLVKGLNDSPEDLNALKQAVEQIRPHRIQLNSVARPPAEPWAKPLSRDRMEEIKKFLGSRAEVVVDFNRRLREGFMPVVEVEIMETLKRRPMTEHDISEILGIESETAETVLDKMLQASMIKKEIFQGRTYYRPSC
jgi:wyosine [tRNA(Phe)-imidazoG37] synthetase (radical SAM superfamily)